MMTAEDIAAALRRAVKMLKKREYCAAQLCAKLQSHHSPDVASAAVAKLQKDGLLSDLRFARMVVRGKDKDGGQWAAARIAEALSGYGIGEADAAVAMTELAEDEQTRAKKALGKKYPEPAKDAKTLASMARFLSARGFDEETIKAATGGDWHLADDI
ncbi:MAG: regulatory protein RecX [Gammaproteobacteria bacterium]